MLYTASKFEAIGFNCRKIQLFLKFNYIFDLYVLCILLYVIISGILCTYTHCKYVSCFSIMLYTAPKFEVIGFNRRKIQLFLKVLPNLNICCDNHN